MTSTVSTLLGRPVWYELMTTDTKAAEAFYAKVIGWTAAPMEGAGDSYAIFSRSGNVQVAGLMKTPAEDASMPPFWAMYVAVPSFDEAVAHIKRLGGAELSPVIDIPKVGRMQIRRAIVIGTWIESWQVHSQPSPGSMVMGASSSAKSSMAIFFVLNMQPTSA